jgi:hypothetical protein
MSALPGGPEVAGGGMDGTFEQAGYGGTLQDAVTPLQQSERDVLIRSRP